MIVNMCGVEVGYGKPCRVVAEIGVNAAGDIYKAQELIFQAKEAGCDFVKFQKRTPSLAVPEKEWHELRDTPFGKMEKLAYREKVEFSPEQYVGIDSYCKLAGIPWFVSVFDIPSVQVMEKVGCQAYKIPSCRVTDILLLKVVASTNKPIILSTGMSTSSEVDIAIRVLEQNSRGNVPELVILQCTSSYPNKAEECNLRVMQTYDRIYDYPVGFSSHKIGIRTCVLAVAAGANMIERHVTLDRKFPGGDNRLSSTFEDMQRLIEEIRYAELCLGDGYKRVYDSELPEMKRLRV